jgi:Reverse transcriptase (RNA-dependent DNA polymerase)
MAEILNAFFTSVFTKEDTRNIPRKEKETEVSLSDIEIIRGNIERKLNKLKNDSAPGPDGISPRLLKEVKREISEPLYIKFRRSLDTGMIPADWRTANLCPIYKKGSKSEPGNYRPVSLTSVPCKKLEGLIKDKIMEHFLAEKLITDNQHSFMPGRSCATNLTIILNKLTQIIDNGNPADVFYLDFAKAFDKVPVPRERLLVKLEVKGVTGKLNTWIGNWLRGRTQRVVIGGKASSKSNVESGVPQGSVLGPPLFDVYIDDIDWEAVLADLMTKFADDTKGSKEILGSQVRDDLQTVLNNLCRWAELWGMEFNVSKCKIVHLGRNNPKYKYYMNGTELKTVQEETYVGIVIDKNLKPGKQCTKAANTASAVLRMIQRNFHYRDRHTFVKLYSQS